MKAELHELKTKVMEMSKDMQELQAAVGQHCVKTPLLIDQASNDLKMKLQDEERKHSLFQETTKSKLEQVHSSIKLVKSEVLSEAKTYIQEQVQSSIQSHTSKLRSDISSETNTNIQAHIQACKQSLTSKFRSDLSEARKDVQAQIQSSIKSVKSEASREMKDQMSDMENLLDTTVQQLKDELSDIKHDLQKQHDKHQVC